MTLNFLICAFANRTYANNSELTAEDARLRSELAAAGLSIRSLDLIIKKAKTDHYTKDFVAIVDYSLPSDRRRFFLINLKEKTFQTFPVSHATGSGTIAAESFTNTEFRLKSSLGFMSTKLHSGKFGNALRMVGLSASNTRINKQASTGPILIHGAEYVSEAHGNKFGHLGRSFGCFAVPYENIQEIAAKLGENALVLSYHDQLWDESQKNPFADVGRTSSAPKTEWEDQENLNGQNGGAPGVYSKTYLGSRPRGRANAVGRPVN